MTFALQIVQSSMPKTGMNVRTRQRDSRHKAVIKNNIEEQSTWLNCLIRYYKKYISDNRWIAREDDVGWAVQAMEAFSHLPTNNLEDKRLHAIQNADTGTTRIINEVPIQANLSWHLFPPS